MLAQSPQGPQLSPQHCKEKQGRGRVGDCYSKHIGASNETKANVCGVIPIRLCLDLPSFVPIKCVWP